MTTLILSNDNNNDDDSDNNNTTERITVIAETTSASFSHTIYFLVFGNCVLFPEVSADGMKHLQSYTCSSGNMLTTQQIIHFHS